MEKRERENEQARIYAWLRECKDPADWAGYAPIPETIVFLPSVAAEPVELETDVVVMPAARFETEYGLA